MQGKKFIDVVIENRLYRAAVPGWDGKRLDPILFGAWVIEAKELGVKSVFSFLSNPEIHDLKSKGIDLEKGYLKAGFEWFRFDVPDRLDCIIPADICQQIFVKFKGMADPVCCFHCFYGVQRTGFAIGSLLSRLAKEQ